MTATFKVGDKVKHETYGEVELAFGPADFASMLGGWVVKKSDGDHAVATPSALSPAAKFKVGDKVRSLGGTRYTIEAGPFFNGTYNEWYAVRNEGGDVVSGGALSLGLVESADTYTHEGVTYDLSATYNDRDDEPWTFKRFGIEVRGGCNGFAPSSVSEPLESVVGLYGPLTKI